MVLPPSAADALAAEAEPWCRRLIGLADLATRGVLVLVESAQQHPLRTLVRTAATAGLRLQLVLDVAALVDVRHGAAVVLCVRPDDAPWLNRQRPLFAHRDLRVFVWASPDTAVHLREHAPDFFDWISHHQRVPPSLPTFVYHGLALAEVPGLLVEGTAGDAADLLARSGVTTRPRTIDGRLRYDELVAALRASDRGWRVLHGVDGTFYARRARWALADVSLPAPTILAGESVHSPGWLLWSAHTLDLFVAVARLAAARVPDPVAVAVAVELEPAAVDLACQLTRVGPWNTDCDRALAVLDVGAALAVCALDRGLELPQALAASAPCIRAAASPALVRRARDAVAACKGILKRGGSCDANVLATAVARARWTRPEPHDGVPPVVRGWHIEALLRGGWRSARAHLAYARVAGDLGHADAQLTWTIRGYAAPGADAIAEPLFHQLAEATEHTDDPATIIPVLVVLLSDLRVREEFGEFLGVTIRLLLAQQAVLRRDIDAADELLREALSVAEASGDPDLEAEVCEELRDLADLRGDKPAVAAWTARTRARRPDAPTEPSTPEDRVEALIVRQDWSAAESAARSALSELSDRDPPARRTALLEHMATALEEQDDLAAAADAYLALREHLRVHGAARHLDAFLADASLARAWISLGELDRAHALLRDRSAELNSYYGEDHLLGLLFDAAAVELHLARQDWPAAETAARRLVEVSRRISPTSADHLAAKALLGRALLRQGRAAEALKPLGEVYNRWQDLRADDPELALDALRDYGDALRSQGDFGTTEKILRELLDRVRAMPRGARRRRHEFDAIFRLENFLVGRGLAQEAGDLCLTAMADDPRLRRPLLMIAWWPLTASGRAGTWEAMLRAELGREEPGDEAWRTEAWERLATACETSGRSADAEAALRQCLALLPTDDPFRSFHLDRLQSLLQQLGRRKEAINVLRELLAAPLPPTMYSGDPTFLRRQFADLLLLEKNYPAAELVADDPNLAGPRMFALYKQGKDLELEQCARAVLESPPKMWPEDALRARLFLALLDIDRGRLDAAQATLIELSETNAAQAAGTVQSAKILGIITSAARMLHTPKFLSELIRESIEYQVVP